ncbi:MAG: DoxX family protein [Bacteroidota bacterium]
MNILLWIAQLLLSSSLLWSVYMKLIYPSDQLAVMWPWTASNPMLVKVTAVVDLLAAIGLILPALLRIQPKLTIYAAYGVVALMIAACIFHILRGEGSLIGINIFFMALALFIAWGRSTKAPIR